MIGDILEFSDLRQISGFDRRADVERWADRIGLPVKPCRGGVWTTLDAINNTLGLQLPDKAGYRDPYPDDII